MQIKPHHVALYLSERKHLAFERNNPHVIHPDNKAFRLPEVMDAALAGLARHKFFYVCPRVSEKTKGINIEKLLSYPAWWNGFPKRYTATIITDHFACLYAMLDWGISGIIFDKVYAATEVHFYNYFILSPENSAVGSADPVRREVARRFIQYILFIERASISVVETSPKKRRHRTPSEKLVNESDRTIYFVDVGWDTTLQVGGFEVGNHWRWQRSGPGFSHQELIFINDYQKKGYTRRAGKERYDADSP